MIEVNDVQAKTDGTSLTLLVLTTVTVKRMWASVLRLPFLLALQKPHDVSLSFQQLYDQLAAPSDTVHEISPTLRFNKVSEEREEVKPIAVYLPGLDGYGISAATYQFGDLSATFDLWRLFIDPTDRSSFREVVLGVASFLSDLRKKTSKPITLIGESCGGLFAAAVALKLSNTNTLGGLVMVNPATSFSQTAWDTIVPQLILVDNLLGNSEKETRNGTNQVGLLTNDTNEEERPLNDDQLPSAYGVLGSLLLSTTIPDTDQLRRIFDTIISTPGTPTDLLDAMVVAFKETERRLPSTLLDHRIEWLSVGTPIVNARIKDLNIPTLVVVGKEDKLLPSEAEAERLVRVIPSAEKTVVQNRGHFVLDENVNLTEAIIYSSIDPLGWRQAKQRYDPISDWVLPGQSTIDRVKESFVNPLIGAHSPVWFSTDSNGKRWKGLSKVPQPNEISSGPILVIANHQLAGLDLSLILTELWEQKGFWPRGLAHPVAFMNSNGTANELGGRTPGILDSLMGRNAGMPSNFQLFGAVKVNPRNYYRLMQTGQHALLFPGGAKEAQSGRKDYPLFWPRKVDFVRTAAKFNATIVPLACIGMVDSVNVLVEPDRIANLPVLGDQLRAFNANISSARFDQRAEDEIIGFPLLVPGLPARNYFLFGKPVSLVDVDPNDREACADVYHRVQQEIRHGLDDLLSAREHDNYKDSVRRLAYERLFGKQAPTFSVDKLN